MVDHTLQQTGAHREIFHQVIDFNEGFPFMVVT
jgi:hypothetical protein